MPNSAQFTQIKARRDFCNHPEQMTREARWLIFYEKKFLTYNQNLKGEFPPADKYNFQVRVNDHRLFKRDIKSKEQAYNRLSDVSIENLYFPMNADDLRDLRLREQYNAYVVVLVTNQDMQVFGNHREGMSFWVEDNVVDNGTGTDSYRLIVEGATTVRPQLQKVAEDIKKEFFRVLLYGNPLR